jgi:hypothetical protein
MTVAEIKSAIELAMERTKHLVMNEEEKRALARRDLEDSLRALMRRFLEGIRGREEFPAEYRGIRDGGEEKGLLLIDLVLEELTGPARKEKVFGLLELVGEVLGGGLAEEAGALGAQFERDLAAGAPGVRERIMGRLAGMGISGSSVEPNLEEWEEWKDAVREMGGLFKGRLSGWREKARAAASHGPERRV